MSAAELPRVESVPGQLVLAVAPVDVRSVLGRVHFERFTTACRLPATWDGLKPGGQDAWSRPTEYLVDAVEQLVADAATERRHRAQWAVGMLDRTLAAQEDADTVTDEMCQHAPGPWTCTRPTGHQLPHVAGDGCVHIAAWGEVP